METFVILEQSRELAELNEMFVRVEKSLPSKIENSVFYPKLKQLLFLEITRFTREKVELKNDLNFLRMNIGETLSDSEIRDYLDQLKLKYNTRDNDVGIDYHVEATRFDYGVPVFIVIKRDVIYMKKLVFRFRKPDTSSTVQGVAISGAPDDEAINESADDRKQRYLKLMGEKDRRTE
jgi:hypothetical protein